MSTKSARAKVWLAPAALQLEQVQLTSIRARQLGCRLSVDLATSRL